MKNRKRIYNSWKENLSLVIIPLFFVLLVGCTNRQETPEITTQDFEVRCIKGTEYYFRDSGRIGSHKGYGYMAPVFIDGEIQTCRGWDEK